MVRRTYQGSEKKRWWLGLNRKNRHRPRLSSFSYFVLPEEVTTEDLAAGRLRRILPDWQDRSTPAYALTETRLLPAKTQRFNPGDPIYRQTLGMLTQAFASQGAGTQAEPMAFAQLAQWLSQQSMLLACLDYFTGIVAVGLIGAGVMLYQRLMR